MNGILPMSRMDGAMIPPCIGRDNAFPEELRVFLRLLFGEYANHVREIGGSGAGNAPIRVRCLIDRSYLELVIRDHLKNLVQRDLKDAKLHTALRREAGIPVEGPSPSESWCVVKKAARMETGESQQRGVKSQQAGHQGEALKQLVLKRNLVRWTWNG